MNELLDSKPDCQVCEELLQEADADMARSPSIFEPGNIIVETTEGVLGKYSRAIETCPEFSDAYYKRALAYTRYGQYENAIVDFTKAINMQGTVGIGINSCTSSIDLPNESSTLISVCFFERGLAKAKMSDIAGSISDFNHAIEIDSTNFNAYFNLGLMESRRRRRNQQNQSFSMQLDRGTEIRYRDIEVYYFSKVIYMNPFHVEAYLNRAIIFCERKEYARAIEDYSIALEIRTDASIYLARGIAYMLMGEPEKGCLDFSSAGELGNTQAFDLIAKYCNYTPTKTSPG